MMPAVVNSEPPKKEEEEVVLYVEEPGDFYQDPVKLLKLQIVRVLKHWEISNGINVENMENDHLQLVWTYLRGSMMDKITG